MGESVFNSRSLKGGTGAFTLNLSKIKISLTFFSSGVRIKSDRSNMGSYIMLILVYLGKSPSDSSEFC